MSSPQAMRMRRTAGLWPPRMLASNESFDSGMEDSLARLSERCASHGLAVTAPREAILRALLDLHEVSGFTALMRHPDCWAAGLKTDTVRRFLRDLRDLGVLERVRAGTRRRSTWSLAPDCRRRQLPSGGNRGLEPV